MRSNPPPHNPNGWFHNIRNALMGIHEEETHHVPQEATALNEESQQEDYNLANPQDTRFPHETPSHTGNPNKSEESVSQSYVQKNNSYKIGYEAKEKLDSAEEKNSWDTYDKNRDLKI
eukprot:GILI01017098.1.p1 GENE.GILI01017098.1~~GILI01017098.1.p1  ORF type:complete len:131 (+),score=13.92 GILI01017098.1:41-394(+)